MSDFIWSVIVFGLIGLGSYVVPLWSAWNRNKKLIERLLLLSEKDESLVPTTFSSKDGHLVTMFDSEVVELSFRHVKQIDKTEVIHFDIVFQQLSFPTWMTVALSKRSSRWCVDKHELSMSDLDTMTYPGFYALKQDLNMGESDDCELLIQRGKVTLKAHLNSEFFERIAARIKHVVVQSSRHLKTIHAQLPEEPWLLLLALCHKNPQNHPVQLEALSVLMAKDGQMPQVQSLIDQALNQWPEPMVVTLLERSEAQFNQQQIMQSLLFRLDTVSWTTRRWLNMAIAAHKEQVAQAIHQKIIHNCAKQLGIEGISTLEQQDKKIVVPLLIAMANVDDTHETHQRLVAVASPMLKWLDLEDAAQWMVQLSQDQPDLCDVKDFALIINRPSAQFHYYTLAKALAFVLSQHPQRMQDTAWCELVVTLFVHFDEAWAPRVFELILNHASPAIFGRLQGQISESPFGRESAMGRIFIENKVLLEDTLRARQGGLTLAESNGPSGGLTLASQDGKLTLEE